jgi:hypothetical protein
VTIYYLCPDYDVPSGGIRKIYQHVDVLNGAGHPAFVLHEVPSFRCSWFENDTPIKYWVRGWPKKPLRGLRSRGPHRWRPRGGEVHLTSPPVIDLDAGDFIVIPEIYGPTLAGIAPSIAKVILNQGAYNTFRSYPLHGVNDRTSPYLHPEVRAAIVVSQDSERYLRAVFPSLKLFKVRNSIDPRLFVFQKEKKRQICYLTQKNRADVVQVLQILSLWGVLDKFPALAIDNYTERETALLFRESLVYLSFGHPEGFGLPSAEAMRCGCLVVGYHGFGGREFLRPEFASPIEAGEIIAFSRAVENVLAEFERDPASLAQRAKRGSEFIAEKYSPERERDELLGAWDAIRAI